MAKKIEVLIICQHISGRSQVAEAYLKQLFGDEFEVVRADLDPSDGIIPLVIEVMREEGVDLPAKIP
jgi:arsenate reductase